MSTVPGLRVSEAARHHPETPAFATRTPLTSPPLALTHSANSSPWERAGTFVLLVEGGAEEDEEETVAVTMGRGRGREGGARGVPLCAPRGRRWQSSRRNREKAGDLENPGARRAEADMGALAAFLSH